MDHSKEETTVTLPNRELKFYSLLWIRDVLYYSRHLSSNTTYENIPFRMRNGEKLVAVGLG